MRYARGCGAWRRRLTVGTLEILERDWTFDSDLACRELGYRVTPLQEGVGRVVEALKKERQREQEAGRGGTGKR